MHSTLQQLLSRHSRLLGQRATAAAAGTAAARTPAAGGPWRLRPPASRLPRMCCAPPACQRTPAAGGCPAARWRSPPALHLPWRCERRWQQEAVPPCCGGRAPPRCHCCCHCWRYLCCWWHETRCRCHCCRRRRCRRRRRRCWHCHRPCSSCWWHLTSSCCARCWSRCRCCCCGCCCCGGMGPQRRPVPCQGTAGPAPWAPPLQPPPQRQLQALRDRWRPPCPQQTPSCQ